MTMAGKAAEIIKYGAENVSNGPAGDIQQASGLARAMILRWGMSDKVGDVDYSEAHEGYSGSTGGFSVSANTKEMIEDEVRRFIQEAYDKALYQFHLDQANLEQTQQSLALKLIRAPFAGTFGLTLKHLGDYVSAGDVLGTLQAPNQFRVDFSVSGNLIHQVSVGDSVLIQSQAMKQPAKGSVYAINSTIDPATRMLAMRAHLTAMAPLSAGMFVEATLLLNPAKKVMLIPQTAAVVVWTS